MTTRLIYRHHKYSGISVKFHIVTLSLLLISFCALAYSAVPGYENCGYFKKLGLGTVHYVCEDGRQGQMIGDSHGPSHIPNNNSTGGFQDKGTLDFGSPGLRQQVFRPFR